MTKLETIKLKAENYATAAGVFNDTPLPIARETAFKYGYIAAEADMLKFLMWVRENYSPGEHSKLWFPQDNSDPLNEDKLYKLYSETVYDPQPKTKLIV